MDVYFDKENLISFISKVISREGHIMNPKVNNMLIEQCDIFLSFKEDDWKNVYSNRKDCITPTESELIDQIAAWMRLATDGSCDHRIKYSSPFPFDKLHSFSEDNYKLFTSVILQNRKNYVNNKTERYGLLSSINSEEISTLQKLFICGRCIPSKIFYMRDEDDRIELDNNIKELPCTDIIIADPWIFSNQEERPYIQNVYTRISLICDSIKEGNTVNVVFYTYEYYKNEEKDTIIPPFEDIRDKIKSTLDINKGINANVTFVKPFLVDKQDTDWVRVQQHDRYIITNYQLLISGNSFNYYNESLEYRSKGVWSTLSSICDRDNFEVFCRILSDIQLAITKCPKNERSHNDPERYIYGDMKSNLLNFDYEK